jgi:hypothetical protein
VAYILSMPVEERIKLMTGMLANGMTRQVDTVLDRTGGAELREFAGRCIRMLAESRLELADFKGQSNE